jgi:tRNA (cmo5U34)-methyltransferase
MSEKGLETFGIESQEYDENARLNKGNRDTHKMILEDLLRYLTNTPRLFFELGCGTGFFSDVFYKVFPGINGTLLDGSDKMLNISRELFRQKNYQANFIHSAFENMRWDEIPEQDIFFSALAIHHLADRDKWEMFRRIHYKLSDVGHFILFDLFISGDKKQDQLLEYLACSDIRRRLKKELDAELGCDFDSDIEELRIDTIIKRDRLNKLREGDQEARLEDIVANLYASGFNQVVVLFQDIRFAGIIASKKGI